MEWKTDFKQAVVSFKQGRWEESLGFMNKALQDGGDQQHVIYDSRAAIYEKMGKVQEALMDAKIAIKLAPARWQSYVRASRLFLRIRRFEEAQKILVVAQTKLSSTEQRSRDALKSLENEVRETRRRCTYHIGTLPIELLSGIFQYLVDDDPHNALALTRISRHWRNIALSTPSLWQTLILSKNSPVRKCDQWIQRSKGRITELRLLKPLTSNLDWNPRHLRGIQWEHIRILRIEELDIANFPEEPEINQFLPRLEAVDIRYTAETMPRCHPIHLIVCWGPKVQHLSVEGTRSCAILPFPNSYRSLLSLTLRRVCIGTLDNLYKMLESNPLLEMLCLEGMVETFDSRPKSDLTLPHLHTLDSSFCAPTVFTVLTLPSLKKIYIRGGAIDTIVTKLLDSGSRSIEELSIVGCALSSNLLIELLSTNPALKSVTLNHLASISNPVIEALASSQLDDILCPLLQHLDLSRCPDVRTGQLIRLVNSRLPTNGYHSDEDGAVKPVARPIRTLKVDGCSGIEAKFLPWFGERLEWFSCVYATRRLAGSVRQ
ncbi:hypothetical protein VNI00_013464 [Paramarasmius palmivorus]|uniref:F-box domain-containing protein n=1 Tax=Paramarasmius palmivorus TaxID=297713 RepID=A0AAW0BZ91_9AGAR